MSTYTQHTHTHMPTHTQHTHMTIHSVRSDCPLHSSTRGTWGYCWATAGGQCWPRPATEGDPHIPHTAVMLHDLESLYTSCELTQDLTIFIMSGCGYSQLMHQDSLLVISIHQMSLLLVSIGLTFWSTPTPWPSNSQLITTVEVSLTQRTNPLTWQ